MNIKKSIIIIFLVLLPFNLFASRIDGIGEGKTREEARLNALIDVSQYIIGMSVSDIITEYESGSVTSSSARFHYNAKGEITAYIIPSEYKDEQKSKNKWNSTVIIDERSESIIVKHATDLCYEIDNLYRKWKSTYDEYAQKEYLWTLWEKLTYYESLIKEASFLGCSGRIPELQNRMTSSIARIELENILNKQERNLIVDSYQKSDDKAIEIAKQEAERINKERELLESYKKEEKEKQRSIRATRLDQEIKMILESTTKIEEINSKGSENDFNELWEKYVLFGLRFKETADKTEVLISKSEEKYKEELSDEIDAINSAIPRMVELGADGKLTSDAITRRKRKIEDAEKRIELEKKNSKSIIINGATDAISNSFKDYAESIKILNNSRFRIEGESVVLKYLGKNQQTASWHFELLFNLFNDIVIKDEIIIPFEAITGISEKDVYENYEQCLYEIDKWSTLFYDFSKFFNVSSDMAVEINAFDNSYRVKIGDSISIKGKDNKEIYKSKFNHTSQWIINNKINCYPGSYDYFELKDKTGETEKLRKEAQKERNAKAFNEFFSWNNTNVSAYLQYRYYGLLRDITEDVFGIEGQISFSKKSFLMYCLSVAGGTNVFITQSDDFETIGTCFEFGFGAYYPLKIKKTVLYTGCKSSFIISDFERNAFDLAVSLILEGNITEKLIFNIMVDYGFISKDFAVGFGISRTIRY